MASLRIALANLQFPESREESLASAVQAIEEAERQQAQLLCFPECYLPGYRAPQRSVAPVDAGWLEKAWAIVERKAGESGVAVVLGTERPAAGWPLASALVIDERGQRLGFQDKVQIDPEEESTYSAGEQRNLFSLAGTDIGIVICHEGWRYPETVRWAARRGARLVVHLQFNEGVPGARSPQQYGEADNSFHEKAVLCRAAENSIWFATVNYASEGSSTTSAVASPDGTLFAWQLYGVSSLLVVDLELEAASGLLAKRCKY
jgi:predicted amidohydrolase